MTEIVLAGDADWERLRAIRLRALADAPDAFGSTLERERAHARKDWLGWIRGWGEATNAVFAALGEGGWIGLAVGSHPPGDPVAHLYAMWVEPRHRGEGVGRALVERVAAWALERGAAELELGVTDANAPAEALYRTAGFVETGVSEPLREGSDLILRVLRRRLAP